MESADNMAISTIRICKCIVVITGMDKLQKQKTTKDSLMRSMYRFFNKIWVELLFSLILNSARDIS